jgi:hypothetical protein
MKKCYKLQTWILYEKKHIDNVKVYCNLIDKWLKKCKMHLLQHLVPLQQAIGALSW